MATTEGIFIPVFGTNAEWAVSTRVLQKGEMALNVTTSPPVVKFGDGTNTWNNTPVYGASTGGGTGDVLTIGTVTTLAAGTSATASISGTSPNKVLNLGIPRGATGATGSNGTQGIQGVKGDTGATGAAGAAGADGAAGDKLTIGTITTLAAGSTATASITGTSPNKVLNLGLPRGATGADGSGGTGGGSGGPAIRLSATAPSPTTTTPAFIVRDPA